MPTDGDKIAAATLAAKLMELGHEQPSNVTERLAWAVRLYGDVLSHLSAPAPGASGP